MIKTADVQKMVALALTSGHVLNEKPVSLLIVSDRPESGKTEIVKKFIGTTGVDFCNDISAFGIRRDLYKKISNGEIRHIVIPELLTPLSKKATSEALVGTLQTLTEDGTMSVHVGFTKEIESTSQRILGVIGCLPRLQYMEHRLEWTTSGFLSRFLVVSYKYDGETVDTIFRSIANCDYQAEVARPLIFDSDVDIKIPFEISRKCVDLAESITKQARERGSTYGFREAKFIIRMVKANVLLDRVLNQSDRDTATESDFDDFSKLVYLINEQFNEVKQ